MKLLWAGWVTFAGIPERCRSSSSAEVLAIIISRPAFYSQYDRKRRLKGSETLYLPIMRQVNQAAIEKIRDCSFPRHLRCSLCRRWTCRSEPPDSIAILQGHFTSEARTG